MLLTKNADINSVNALIPAIVGVVFFSSSSLLSADVYKWVDKHGRVHYGDKALSEDAREFVIKKSRSDNSYEQRKEKREKLLDIYQEDREKRKADHKAKTEEKKIRKENCLIVKKELEQTRQASYLYEDSDDPKKPKILSDEERQQAERKLEEDVKKWCG